MHSQNQICFDDLLSSLYHFEVANVEGGGYGHLWVTSTTVTEHVNMHMHVHMHMEENLCVHH